MFSLFDNNYSQELKDIETELRNMREMNKNPDFNQFFSTYSHEIYEKILSEHTKQGISPRVYFYNKSSKINKRCLILFPVFTSTEAKCYSFNLTLSLSNVFDYDNIFTYLKSFFVKNKNLSFQISVYDYLDLLSLDKMTLAESYLYLSLNNLEKAGNAFKNARKISKTKLFLDNNSQIYQDFIHFLSHFDFEYNDENHDVEKVDFNFVLNKLKTFSNSET